MQGGREAGREEQARASMYRFSAGPDFCRLSLLFCSHKFEQDARENRGVPWSGVCRGPQKHCSSPRCHQLLYMHVCKVSCALEYMYWNVVGKRGKWFDEEYADTDMSGRECEDRKGEHRSEQADVTVCCIYTAHKFDKRQRDTEGE